MQQQNCSIFTTYVECICLSVRKGGALVNIYTDGSVLLSHGGIEMGQGLHTKMVQVKQFSNTTYSALRRNTDIIINSFFNGVCCWGFQYSAK